MSIIKLPLLYIGTKTELNLYTLFDSGANFSCIHPDFAHEISVVHRLGRIRQVATASEGHFIEISEVIGLDFYVNDILIRDEFLVVPGLSEEAVIGAYTMQKYRIKLNFDKECVEMDPKVAKLQLKKADMLQPV